MEFYRLPCVHCNRPVNLYRIEGIAATQGFHVDCRKQFFRSERAKRLDIAVAAMILFAVCVLPWIFL